MNGKRNATLAVVGILVILGAVLSIVLRLWLAVDEGKAQARAAFDELATTFGSAGSIASLSDRDRRLGLVNLYASDRRLLVVWVTDRDRGILWRLPDRSPYLPTSENYSREPRVIAPNFTTALFRTDWSGEGRRAEIDALYVTVSQEKAFVIFRDAAIGLGSWFLVSLFVILIGGSEGERVTWRPGVARNVIDGDTGPTSSEPEASAEAEDFDIPEIEATSAAAKELYSPASGLGYASWLEERLGSELSRAAAIEQDLSILVMSLDGLSQGSEDYGAIAQSLRDFFSFRDLAFERDEDGFSVILPNLDAGHALRMAEEFHKKVAIQVRGHEDRVRGLEERGSKSALPLYMGLSSRAGRLVEARRLIDEAGLALERAREEDDSKIVAFKPDPDKYRLWLASMGHY